MNGAIRPYAMQKPCTAPIAAHTTVGSSSAPRKPCAEPYAARTPPRAKTEPDHERHAQRDDGEERRLDHDVRQAVAGGERVEAQAADDQQQGEHDERTLLAGDHRDPVPGRRPLGERGHVVLPRWM
jgi:hypothetical protein